MESKKIENIVVSYFQILFSSHTPQRQFDEIFLEAEFSTLSVMRTQEMETLFTGDEIVRALKDMHPSKAPGLDGFHAAFFKRYWSIVGMNIIALALRILNDGTSMNDTNHTYIVLIPKIKNDAHMSDFMSISLYNIVYRLVAKALANRLKNSLPSVIKEA